MITMNYFTINLLSSTRAYINGESHYARSQKNAGRNLLLYVYSAEPIYYKRFEHHINIPIKDSLARVMMNRNENLASIKKVLLSAGNTQENVNDFLWLGKKIYQFPFLSRAFIEWKEADLLIGQLHVLGKQINQAISKGRLSENEKIFYAKRINKISQSLMLREVNFSKILNGGIKDVTFWVYVANIFIILIIFGSSILKSGLLINSLAKTKTELEVKNELLTTTNEELDKFVYSASHDLRAPLASLKGLIMLANEEKNPNEIKNYHLLMLQTVEKQDRFISDIIDFSRNKKTEKVMQIVQLEELIDESIEQHIYYYRDHAIQIKKKIEVNKVISDPIRLKIILNNLISNAVKYGDPLKPVTIIKILSYQTENSICIEVIDNGIGIEKEEINKIFDMFFVSAKNDIGTGLGLYIAKESTLKLGGTISVHSHIGMGTKFTVCLPLDTVENQSPLI